MTTTCPIKVAEAQQDRRREAAGRCGADVADEFGGGVCVCTVGHVFRSPIRWAGDRDGSAFLDDDAARLIAHLDSEQFERGADR